MTQAGNKPTESAEQASTIGRPTTKRAYSTPVLTLFGHVAALTAGVNCSAANDGAGSCPSAGGTSMGMNSDRRLKQDVTRIADHPAGFGLYLFRYRPEFRDACGHGRRFGVMADEIEQVMPEAVITKPDGFKLVRYDLLGIVNHLH